MVLWNLDNVEILLQFRQRWQISTNVKIMNYIFVLLSIFHRQYDHIFEDMVVWEWVWECGCGRGCKYYVHPPYTHILKWEQNIHSKLSDNLIYVWAKQNFQFSSVLSGIIFIVKGSLSEEMFPSNYTWESIYNLSFIPHHGIETFFYIIIIELDTIAKKCSNHSTFYVNVSLNCGEIYFKNFLVTVKLRFTL